MAIMEETTFDPRRRRLCPDGACVGLIGDNGRCKVCGTPAGGVTPAAPATDDGVDPYRADSADDLPDSASNAGGAAAEADAAVSGDDGGAPAASAGGFDPNRRLCDDGACVGVIGPSGACSVCGRRPE